MKRRYALCALAFTLAGADAGADTGADDDHAHEHTHDQHPDAETIIVTATPLEHARDELAMPVQRLQRGEILRRLGSSLGETLSGVPGVATSGYAPGASRPVIRGQDAFRSEVLEDGLTTQDVSRLSPDHAVPVNPLAADSIEVVRGPATLRYGGGATAGVVNTITGRIPQTAPGVPIEADLYSSYGTNDDEGVVALRARGSAGDFAWHADGVYQRADDYETGAGDIQAGTAYQGGAAALGVSWISDRARIGGAYSHYRNDYGIPSSGEAIEIDMDTNRYRFEADLDEPFRGTRRLRVSTVYSDYEHVEIADGTVGQTFDNDEFEGRAELLHEPLAGFTGALGLTGRHRDFEAGGEAAAFLSPTTTQTVAGYLFEERELSDALAAHLGVRVEGTRVEGTPITGPRRERSFIPVSGSLSLLATPFEGWSLGLTGAVSQRAPADVELFASGPHEATGTFEVGDPDLDEETGYTGELRLAGDLERVRIELATFITRYDDYVFGSLSGATVDEDRMPVAPDSPGALDELFYLSRDALFYGGELAIEADLLEVDFGRFLLDAQFDWVRARFVNVDPGVDRDIPRVTPIRWGAGLAFEGDRIRGRFGFLRTERQRYPGENETATGAFTMVDLDLAYTLGLFSDRAEIDLAFAVRNLADEAARNPIAINRDEVRLRGRTFRLGLRARF